MQIKIIDNFLNNNDFSELCNIKLKNLGKDEVKVYHNRINKVGEIKSECLNENTVRRLNNNYHKKAEALLEELCPEKVKLYDYSEFHIIETGANFKFPIHDDTPNKLLSGVVYLKPENNFGTIFYNSKKGDGERIIEWKQNRAVFFSRKEGESWHSYKGDGKNNRIALVYNLMTNNIKDVCKIENKSYLVTIFREKINPYLFKFFKFTI